MYNATNVLKTIIVTFVVAMSGCAGTFEDLKYSERVIGILPSHRLATYFHLQKVATIRNTTKGYIAFKLECRDYRNEERDITLAPNEECRLMLDTNSRYYYDNVCEPVRK